MSYGSQTHPADGCAGLIVTSPARRPGGPHPRQRLRARRARRDAQGARSPRRPPRSPTPASTLADIDVIKTHNPFAVNDLWFARETGADVDAMNPFGCSLIYGHPQAPDRRPRPDRADVGAARPRRRPRAVHGLRGGRHRRGARDRARRLTVRRSRRPGRARGSGRAPRGCPVRRARGVAPRRGRSGASRRSSP